MKRVFEKIRKGESVTLDFVGDSVTYGLNHCRPEETYVAKVAALFAREFPMHTVYRYDGIPGGEFSPLKSFDGPVLVSLGAGAGEIHVIRNGVGGNTVLRAMNRIDDFTGVLPSGARADVITVMLGINDALLNDPAKYVTAEVYKEHYRALLTEIRHREPEAAIVMLASTDNDQTIDAHCEASRLLAEEMGIPYIDTHALWVAHRDESLGNYGHGDWLYGNGDACHPMPKAAEITAKFIFDGLTELGSLFTEEKK